MQHSVFDPCSSLNAALPLIIVLRFEFHTLPLGSTKTGAREGGTLWPFSPSLAAVAAAAAATSACVSWKKVRNRNRKIPQQ